MAMATPGPAGQGAQNIKASGEMSVRALNQLINSLKSANLSTAQWEKLISSIIKKSGKGFNVIRNDIDGISGAARRLAGEFEDLKGKIEEAGAEKGLDPKKIKEYYEEAEALKKQTAENIKDLEKLRKLGPKAWETGEIQQVLKSIHETQKEVEKFSERIDASKMSTAGLFGEWTDGIKTLTSFKGIFSGSPKQMQEQATAAGEVGKKLKNWGTDLAKANGVRGLIGKGMVDLGLKIGSISKLLGGWPGLIIWAAVKIADMYMKVDAFVKNANKAFASIRGPDIMTDDVAKQFREFNDQIYNIRDNLAVGLNADEIRGFMQAVSQAGLQVESFNDGIHTYRTAITSAAKASKILGIELPQVGAIMADLTTNFRMKLEDIDTTFVQVAFDAKKSGLTTDVFLSAVQSASSELAFYGKFIDSASMSMKALTESQIDGAKESAAQTAEMFQLFTKNTYGVNATLAEFAKKSGMNLDKAFGEAADKATAEVKDIQSKINVSVSGEETDKLRKQMAAAQERSNRALEMIGKDSVVQGTEMALLADKTPELLMNIIKGITGVKDMSELTGENIYVATGTLEKMGFPRELVRKMIEQQKVATIELQNLYGVSANAEINAKGFYKKLIKLDKKQLPRIVDGLNGLKKEMTDDEMSKAVSEQTKILAETYKINETEARAVVESAAADPEFNTALQDILATTDGSEKSQEQAAARLKELLSKSKTGEAVTKFRFRVEEKDADSRKKAADDTFKQMLGQTLSMEDMTKITEQGLKWNLAMLAKTDKITSFVDGIFRLMAKGKLSPQEENLYKNISQIAGKTVTKSTLGAIYSDALGKTDKKSQEIVNNTQSLMDGNDDIAKAVMNVVTSSQVATNKLIKGMSDATSDTITEDDMAALLKSKKLDPSVLKKSDPFTAPIRDAINAIWQKTETGYKKRGEKEQASNLSSIIPPGLQEKQGLQTPEMVTDPGAVVLHPNEMILPKDYSGFKAKPLAGQGAGATPGAPVTKNFNIVVNATETNLANKIANEIRALLYKESMAEIA